MSNPNSNKAEAGTTSATSATSATKIQYEQCACNYFQAVAIQLNIRYSVGISFPTTDTTTMKAALKTNQIAVLW